MRAVIFLEGGGDSKELHVRCREGFRKLLQASGFKDKLPRLVACGGRDAVFDDFKTEHADVRGNKYVAMWIDSEEPMTDTEAAWKHLAGVTTVHRWTKPRRGDDEQVLFMTTCMETYIVADRDALHQHYGSELQESALPAVNKQLEVRIRHDVQDKLVHATRKCSNAYRKGKRSFEIVGKLTPGTLKKHLPSFARVLRILKAKL